MCVWGGMKVFVCVLSPDDLGKTCDPCQKRNDKSSSFTTAWRGVER